jgi:hypothetical protein
MPDVSAKPASFDDPVWRTQYMLEWLGTFRYNKMMGGSGDTPIHYFSEVKSRGEYIKVPLLGAMRKNGVSGNMVLEGREEKADEHLYNCRIEHWRNAIGVTEWDERRRPVELLPQLRPLLMNWSKTRLRDYVTDGIWSTALHTTIHVPLRNPDATQVLSGDPAIVNVQAQATTTQLNAWLTANGDRIMFGGNDTVPVAGNFASSVAACTTATDYPSAANLTKLKDRADLAHKSGYGIEPLRIGDDDETGYVLLCSLGYFNKLRNDTDIKEFNKALVQTSGSNGGGKSNPYFASGDLMWDNIVIKRIPEMGEHRDIVNTTDKTFSRAALLGKQAVALCLGDDTQFRPLERDYGNSKSVAIRESLGVGKIQRELANGSRIDYGVVSHVTRH